MAKKLTNKDRVKQVFLEADEAESRALLDLAQLIVEMRFQGAAKVDKPKRGRPAKVKPQADLSMGVPA